MTSQKASAAARGPAQGKQLQRLLIEDWLPAAAIGVECARERSTGQQPPDKRLHVWWARRPLTVSRAAVLASLLPADFPRETFEKLLGFGGPGQELVRIRRLMDTGHRVPGGFGCERAFKRRVEPKDFRALEEAIQHLWGNDVCVIDPMAGGGSIPLESARMGLRTIANEYNPVACTVLEATVDYPFRYGPELAQKTLSWGTALLKRCEKRVGQFFPAPKLARVHAYIFARTVPCPDTQFDTPLVPDWHLLKPKTGTRLVAVPRIDERRGSWTCDMKFVGNKAGQIKDAPHPTYDDGKGISLFSKDAQLKTDYIKAMAQQGRMKSALYAVALKTPQGIEFRAPDSTDLNAIAAAEKALAGVRSGWEKANIIPTETIPRGVQPSTRLDIGGIKTWADLFAPRQLLTFGVLVEELRSLRQEIAAKEPVDEAQAIEHLLAMALDKLANHNCILARFENTRHEIKGIFGRHGYEFHPTHAEMAPCNAGAGLMWAIENVLEAYEAIGKLPRSEKSVPPTVNFGSAVSLPQIDDGAIAAVVVDPPYDDNVQYAELANFFYVWLKRTQGHRRPDWFSSNLCETGEEAVVNVARHRDEDASPREAKLKAREHYRQLMTAVFGECKRILRDDGVLTVMFTHKKQEAWEALFASLIKAGFTITATWPVKTESEHSLHQAKKNAAQSTVILVARKRPPGAGKGYFDSTMQQAIRKRALDSASRLSAEGLNPVDQLVGSFGPAMEEYSRFDDVVTDTGAPVGVERAIDEASNAVSQWRISQLAQRGLKGVEPEGQFYLLCWDVLGAAEFRFNEARLLGHAVGMDVDQLVAAGLVTKEGDKIRIEPVKARRREKAIEADKVHEYLFPEAVPARKRTKAQALKVHPNDPAFRTALDGCHALALRYLEAGAGAGGVGNAKALRSRQNWTKDSPVARLMEALVHATPEALRFANRTKKGSEDPKAASTQFPEFRAWHALLNPLFGITPPEWKQPEVAFDLFGKVGEDEGGVSETESDEEEGDEA